MITSEFVFSSLVIRTPLSNAATAEVFDSDESDDPKGPRAEEELVEPLLSELPPRREEERLEELRRVRLLLFDEELLVVVERLLRTCATSSALACSR